MPFIHATVIFVTLLVGDAYYFEGQHITNMLAHAREFDAAAEQQINRVMHFKR